MNKIASAARRRKGAIAPEIPHPGRSRDGASVYDFGVLTRGGARIHTLTHRPVATCNLLANLAGLGNEEDR